jgi:hypothetical protein
VHSQAAVQKAEFMIDFDVALRSAAFLSSGRFIRVSNDGFIRTMPRQM